MLQAKFKIQEANAANAEENKEKGGAGGAGTTPQKAAPSKSTSARASILGPGASG